MKNKFFDKKEYNKKYAYFYEVNLEISVRSDFRVSLKLFIYKERYFYKGATNYNCYFGV